MRGYIQSTEQKTNYESRVYIEKNNLSKIKVKLGHFWMNKFVQELVVRDPPHKKH